MGIGLCRAGRGRVGGRLVIGLCGISLRSYCSGIISSREYNVGILVLVVIVGIVRVVMSFVVVK